jgi:hypothetical protein
MATPWVKWLLRNFRSMPLGLPPIMARKA